MDLSYGPSYEAFRSEVKAFLDDHANDAPRGGSMRSPKVLAWQKTLIEHGTQRAPSRKNTVVSAPNPTS